MDQIRTSTPVTTKRKLEEDSDRPVRKRILEENRTPRAIFVHLDESDIEISFPKTKSKMGGDDMDTQDYTAQKTPEEIRDDRLCATMKAHFDASTKDIKTHFEGLLTSVERRVSSHDVDVAEIKNSIRRIERSTTQSGPKPLGCEKWWKKTLNKTETTTPLLEDP